MSRRENPTAMEELQEPRKHPRRDDPPTAQVNVVNENENSPSEEEVEAEPPQQRQQQQQQQQQEEEPTMTKQEKEEEEEEEEPMFMKQVKEEEEEEASVEESPPSDEENINASDFDEEEEEEEELVAKRRSTRRRVTRVSTTDDASSTEGSLAEKRVSTRAMKLKTEPNYEDPSDVDMDMELEYNNNSSSSNNNKDDMNVHPKPPKKRSRVGTKLRKSFDAEYFNGVVTKRGPEEGTWHVVYEDSDSEDVSDNELDILSATYKEYRQKHRSSPAASRVGKKFRKEFDAEYYTGTVTRKGPDGTWHVKYEEDSDSEDISEDELDSLVAKYKGQTSSSSTPLFATTATAQPAKSSARRHKQDRLKLDSLYDPATDEDGSSDEEFFLKEGDRNIQKIQKYFEPFKIQKIISSRTEPLGTWSTKVCYTMNTSEINHGSRWVQERVSDDSKMEQEEERFLVKWNDLSYMHCSWETKRDLLHYIENAKQSLTLFARKCDDNGNIFDSDERKDGDYFDPARSQVDRILEVYFPDECPCKTVDNEDTVTHEELGIVVDPNDTNYESGLGRQFLIKWGTTSYESVTYEFERDLVLNDIDYKNPLKAFQRRSTKMDCDTAQVLCEQGENERERLYKQVFGDNSDTKLAGAVQKYQQSLQAHTYKNGGQLRDYQAEGVAWMLANFLNGRSSILADEMGLGKTIQLAAFINILATQFHRRGPFLIIVPLSTLFNWQNELEAWLDMNVIIYHGSSKDRDMIRRFEFANEEDRPKQIRYNELYLRKCAKKAASSVHPSNPWMAEVVITTPELLCKEDYTELTAISWQCLIVDEAHRLKNHKSNFAVNLRDGKFEFGHKVLLTGTPIQNSMEELFALLNFIAPSLFDSVDAFMERYGDLKDKETIDDLHEEIRPYILRRLKEDVEKSVPPKEETLIEVELTIAQKQYYRALYEKNLKFLHRNKKSASDGPSLRNLAMQLRKCCNHLYLLNGIEDEFRKKEHEVDQTIPEGDVLVKASGKLVLLDKLLPRLKANGHRILLFSQFKIMLDVLEDYLNDRAFKYERIDGSITGKQRQQAIDRFQADDGEGGELPFVMLLSTRAGGVGINLTAADTVIIYDSDWNPQNDVQAQARCHRIGQTKDVKVYRLLSRKTYEMQMFHMASLKMGLDQAVLSGFEAGSSKMKGLTKAEIEKLLKRGAYDIFSEEKNGVAEVESNRFVEQSIDEILARRSRTVVYENTGSHSSAAGGTFSKARFAAAKGSKNSDEDVDIEDPEFWVKCTGKTVTDDDEKENLPDKRSRTVSNYYNEANYEKELLETLMDSDKEGKGKDEDNDNESAQADDDSFQEGASSSSESDDDDLDDIMNEKPSAAKAPCPASS